MLIRKSKKSDTAKISRLYYDTVHVVNAQDYTERQINAWAPTVYEEAFWRLRFQNTTVFVAEEVGVIVGFADFEITGRLDCFYVHHEWQGRSVGIRLLNHIEATARKQKISRLFAEVSITAMPFFKKMDFRIVRRQKKFYRNCSFMQFFMEKRI